MRLLKFVDDCKGYSIFFGFICLGREGGGCGVVFGLEFSTYMWSLAS